ncbi:MAG: OmpA family protein [Chitinophagaceae bacterium]|nr:OmpA family protein [Chitinophagaceae bacterium]MCZ2396458.1 OmpA family protein [Chitinophagales bacterium]
MKLRTTILMFVSIICVSVNAQIINPKETVKRKAEDKTNQKIDETIDNGLNKLEEGIGDLFKGKKKKEKNKESKSQQTANNSDNNVYDPPKTKTDDKGNTDYSAYKNFGFVPGEQIIFFEDFKDGSKGRWGAYDIDNEVNVVNHNGTNWMEVKSGAFYPLGLKALPKNFTLEFDVYTPDINTGSLDIRFVDQSQAGALGDPWLDNSSQVTFSPKTQMPQTALGSYQKKINNEELNPQNEFRFYSWLPESGNHYARISLSRNNNKVSVWVNKEQVLDNIDLLAGNLQYLLSFHLQNYFVAENRMYLTHFRLATGVANPKTELESNKKFITQNIYFDVNSDVIRPNSYAILREIAQSINSTQGNILIVGHTDSDGSDAANLELSKKRAESVKRALVNEFGIGANRLSTDGKGESVPLNKNSNPSEKAANRRVEFIKL